MSSVQVRQSRRSDVCAVLVNRPGHRDSYAATFAAHVSYALGWVVLGFVVNAALVGCSSAPAEQEDIRIDLTITPDPPVVGTAGVVVTLTDNAGQPLEDAHVQLEGNMNHAGMRPSFAYLEEAQPGTYEGSLEFTMAGDWYVLANATMPDGEQIQRQIDVRGVVAE